jgi:predicted amidophosphoribosyltransferase
MAKEIVPKPKCPNCHKQLEEKDGKLKCPGCSFECSKNADVCSKCGVVLDEEH